MNSPKILTQQNSESPIAYFDDKGVFALNSCTYITSENEEALKSITGILNSNMMEFYFKATYTNFARITINILPNNLHPLPVKISKDIGKRTVELQELKVELDSLELNQEAIISKYGSDEGTELSKIVEESDFVNKISDSSRASIKALKVEQDDEVLLIKAKKYDGWIDAIKLSIDKKTDRNYLAEYLESLDEEEIDNSETKLIDNLLKIKVNDWNNSQVKKKIVEKIHDRKKEIKELERTIRIKETELEARIFQEYRLNKKEVEEILETLEMEEHTRKAIISQLSDT
jgi:hypothetical protein